MGAFTLNTLFQYYTVVTPGSAAPRWPSFSPNYGRPYWSAITPSYYRPNNSFQSYLTGLYGRENFYLADTIPPYNISETFEFAEGAAPPEPILASVSEGLAVNASARTDIPLLPVDYQIAASSFSASSTLFVSIIEGIGINDAANKTWIEINSPSNPVWTPIEAASPGSAWTVINTPSDPTWTLIETP